MAKKQTVPKKESAEENLPVIKKHITAELLAQRKNYFFLRRRVFLQRFVTICLVLSIVSNLGSWFFSTQEQFPQFYGSSQNGYLYPLVFATSPEVLKGHKIYSELQGTAKKDKEK